METAASTSIVGLVNNYGNGTDIGGWVTDPANGRNNSILVSAYMEGRLVSKVTAESERPDKRFSFKLNTAERIRAIDILSGRFRVYAQSNAEVEVELPLQKAFLVWMTKVAFGESMMANMDLPAAQFVIERLITTFGPSLLSGKSIEVPETIPASPENDITPLFHSVGTITADRSAILGRDGVIFLYEGGNSLVSQYRKSPTDAAILETLDQWKHLFIRRKTFLDGLGICYCQSVIPEKTTVDVERFPETVAVPTPLFDGLENWALETSNAVSQHYVPIYRAFRAHPDRPRMFLRTDSHFSVRGALTAFQLMLATIAAQIGGHDAEFAEARRLLHRPDLFTGRKKVVSGDLTMRFFGTRLYESDDEVTSATALGRIPRLALHSEFIPTGGGTTGIRRVWSNPDAPINLRVVSFGNSFFERGSSPSTMGWWFSHFFVEYHLVWSREMLENYVMEVLPDCVVCQTVERFLTIVPTR